MTAPVTRDASEFVVDAFRTPSLTLNSPDAAMVDPLMVLTGREFSVAMTDGYA
jgi:hypothetical protein